MLYLIFEEDTLYENTSDKTPGASLLCLGHAQLGLASVAWHI